MKSIYAFETPDKPEKCPKCGDQYKYNGELKLCAEEFWLCELCAKKLKKEIASYANKRNFDAFTAVMADAELGHKVREALQALVAAAKIS